MGPRFFGGGSAGDSDSASPTTCSSPYCIQQQSGIQQQDHDQQDHDQRGDLDDDGFQQQHHDQHGDLDQQHPHGGQHDGTQQHDRDQNILNCKTVDPDHKAEDTDDQAGKETEEEKDPEDCSVVQMPLRVGITLLKRMGHKGSPTLDVGARCEGWDCKPSGPRAGARTDGGTWYWRIICVLRVSCGSHLCLGAT